MIRLLIIPFFLIVVNDIMPPVSNNTKFSIEEKDTVESEDENINKLDISHYTGIPIISIFTKNGQKVLSTEEYINGNAYIYNGKKYDDLAVSLRIRGRGNTSWYFPKKSYQIHFDKKQEVLGIPKDKKWILLANYNDKTMLRNEIAFELGRLSNLDWTPESRFVDLFINNNYSGVYLLTQKVEQSSNRVDIGKNGFLIEIDQLWRLNSSDVYFKNGKYLFAIKEPKLKKDDENYLFIKNYLQMTEKAIFGNNFLDPIDGYNKYIDTESFVDWYLINEITKNNDAKFYSSVYMNLVPGGKLKMGPIWDFDISLGNTDYNGNENPIGFWIKKAPWIRRLFQDPEFVSKVKKRFKYFYKNKDHILKKITSNASYLNDSQVKKYAKWKTLGVQVKPNCYKFDIYEEEVTSLIKWLNSRMEYLNNEFNDM